MTTQIVISVPESLAATWDRTPGIIQDRIQAAIVEVLQRELGVATVSTTSMHEGVEYARP